MEAKLDKEERLIERSAAAYRPVSKKEQARVEVILARVRKTRNVNIRISEALLEQLKARSREEGIPYQTLISSVLHRFVTHRLVDERAICTSLQLLSSDRYHRRSHQPASRQRQQYIAGRRHLVTA